jgi:electron transfer flavoprotein beta subunit
MKTYDGTYKTKILTNDELDISVTKRKVTQLRKYEVKSSKQQKLVMISGKDEEEKAAQVLQLLKQKSVI